MKIGITGCRGKMGLELLKLLVADKDIEVTGGLEKDNSGYIGSGILDFIIGKNKEIKIAKSPLELFEISDVVIDFTEASASVEYARIASETKTALVIGTTGLNEEQIAEIKEYSDKTPILKAANMSLGINLLQALVKKTAHLLGDDFDIEILEMHHNQKKDAPSGTALSLGEAAASGLGSVLTDVTTNYDRNGVRKKGSIGFASMRGGDVVGEHDVIFAGLGERVILSHKATSRVIFAKGAIRAAKWLKGQSNGLYDMSDVLGIREI
ncbi:MAG: 4-hydroxy-tetrahydrodipicolinate reductase [Alphaproteobacteria bacterium]